MIKKATVPKKIPINRQVITFLSRVASGKDNPTTAIMKAMAVPERRTARHTRQPKAHRPTGTGGFQGSGSGQGECRQHSGRY